MDTRHKAIRASRFVLLTLKPMQHIALDMIGILPISKQFKFILVIIDTFTRYMVAVPDKGRHSKRFHRCAMATLMPF